MTFIDSLRNYLSPQILVILCLGFISGVPYGVLMDPLNYWLSEEGIEKWAEINRKYSEIWPNINEKKDPPTDAEKWQNVKDKYNKYFSEKPGR